MIWRHELKFLIDEATFHNLYFSLRPIMLADSHAVSANPAGIGSYQIRSLYFDDVGRSSIFDKLAGADPRHKFRIRIYNDSSDVIHLEKKVKSGNMTQKWSCPLNKDLVNAVLDGNPEMLLDESHRLAQAENSKGRQRESQLLLQFYAEIRTRLLAPLLLVDYDRVPLIWPDGNVRVTFDRHLATGIYRRDLWDPAAAMLPVMDPGRMIMEVKFDHFLPDFIQSLLPLSGASQLSVSKYVQCAGACRSQNWEDQS